MDAQVQEYVQYEVDSFQDSKDGKTSTLIITCSSGKEVKFIMPIKKIDSLDTRSIYNKLQKECST